MTQTEFISKNKRLKKLLSCFEIHFPSYIALLNYLFSLMYLDMTETDFNSGKKRSESC